ncbi:hypothetical protein GOBAR_AA39619 [Gossypium barbadense]|uniref:Uncharacterized protein n=1 Tax=Gossypium barbadense TaxID=3634 RepID=A0A2P5VQH3_GOSBA|nr:hypothetical protein GOBAR_AA39619 [Gossypium barbadense]
MAIVMALLSGFAGVYTEYYIVAYVDAPGYQILKNLNIISTGVLYRIILKRKLSEIQWAAFILLCAGCITAQLNSRTTLDEVIVYPIPALLYLVKNLLQSDHVLQTPLQGWIMAIAIIKKRPSRNINVQNFWLYIFGMAFNAVAKLIQDFDAVMNKGFFHGYSIITTLMILNHALSGIAVSMVMKYADNIVKVYSTSVAMLLTAIVSVFLFGFNLTLAFFLGAVGILALCREVAKIVISYAAVLRIVNSFLPSFRQGLLRVGVESNHSQRAWLALLGTRRGTMPLQPFRLPLESGENPDMGSDPQQGFLKY